jgi:3'(2'), 5'-bisphosphate nucleotidase
MYKKELEIAIEASIAAGKEILNVYHSDDFSIEEKADKSPLTLADTNAHNKIMAYLSQLDIPVLSEEGREIDYSERKNWKLLWIVDPLDGTKEFIKRNGEFTVNIALIKNNTPIMGVIYVPVKNTLYFGLENLGAYKIENCNETNYNLDNLISKSQKLPIDNGSDKYVVVGSRSHMSKETQDYFSELQSEHGDIEIVSMGSSLKICLVAEGVANEYPRFAPTMEWDTAAGQGIAIAAGKTIIDFETNKPMVYNRENLLNNWFIVK